MSLFDMVPPNDIEAEAAVLGAVIIDNKCIGHVVLILQRDDFYKRAHGTIYEAMVALWDGGQAIDLLTLREALTARGVFEDTGGIESLCELAEAVPSAANVTEYANMVREASVKRSLLMAHAEGMRKISGGQETAGDLLEAAQSEILSIAERSAGQQGDESIQQLMTDVFEDINRSRSGSMHGRGIPSGFIELDVLLDGFHPGEMIIVAGRPSMGKTALALTFMRHVAGQGRGVLLFSMEMAERAIGERLLAMEARVDAGALRRGYLGEQDYLRVNEAVSSLHELPIWICDKAGLTPLELRTRARLHAHKHPVDLIIVDYIQLMGSNRHVENRQQEVTQISRGIKGLARELNVPVIALSQLNRSSEMREGHKPRLADLRESGALEQDADVVMFVHRPGWYSGDNQGETELIVAKQRNGATGPVPLVFIGSQMRFESGVRGQSEVT